MPKDATLISTHAFPAAAANVDCTGIDTGAARTSPKGVLPSGTELEISWEAVPNLVDAKNITFTIQDSADNSTFTTLRIQHVITGANSAGAAAGSKRFHLPATVRQYVNVNAAVDSGGGTNTAKYFTAALVVGQS